MAISKQAAKPARQRSGATLEGAVLRALSEASSGQLLPLAAPKHLVAKKVSYQRLNHPPKVAATKAVVPASFKGLSSPSADELAKTVKALREQLSKFGLLRVETVRVRPQGTDRQLRVEYAVDPGDRQSVFMRVSLTSDVPMAAPPTMLTTQQAADALNVSRPYITRLVDNGKVQGVERTQSGHRRIPAAEVERLQAEMRSTRRKALEIIDAATQDLRQRELSAAKTKSKRRWVAKQT